MKLSEFKGERAIEVIADLIEPIANIAADQKNLQLFVNEKREGETDAEFGVREVKEKIPKLLKTHKKDIITILSVLNEKDANDFNMIDIIKGTTDLINDEEFKRLFLSANDKGEQKPRTESSEVAEHSEPEQ